MDLYINSETLFLLTLVVYSTKVLLVRFHRKDVLDMEWSTDDAHLITGSVDNSCIIWDVCKGNSYIMAETFVSYQLWQSLITLFAFYIEGSVHQILDGHLHYVQGVSWDPLGHYVASLSSDRTCRIYGNKPLTTSKGLKTSNYAAQHVITKAEQQLPADSKVMNFRLSLSSFVMQIMGGSLTCYGGFVFIHFFSSRFCQLKPISFMTRHCHPSFGD